jgi:tetratricopeptide (TPR) repeat protein
MPNSQKQILERNNTSQSPAGKKLVLPDAPAHESGPVKAWEQAVSIWTYEPGVPDPNPMFLEKRVYQGSSGRVYPVPVIDRIATEPVEREWKAVHLENEFLRLMILPEIGGRIHVGYDKTAGYDFFYRQNVIKPALVGLAGPWISGGVEFNWPQHHRPATFMPVETEIERGADGSVTVWCSDHDPMQRMKGMHGVCLHPGRAYIELKVRLYNRTQSVQTFLWWANVACRVHEKYQSFFPPDVRFVADHAKRAITSFPLSDRPYYGVDYAERARKGVPSEEVPRMFMPDGSYPPNDLSWYANIPVPTSYMITGTKEDFFGGYDHKAEAGIVHVADHHIAPGKKQWTWGNHEFGYAWDRNLTDEDGPYIELMAGVYTDNQPDFSFLAPGETKSFSQFWYPIHKIGPPQAANLDAAVSLHAEEGAVRIGVCVTRQILRANIWLKLGKDVLAAWTEDLHPARTFLASCNLPEGTQAEELAVSVEESGRELVHFCQAEVMPAPEQEAAKEPPLPAEIATNEELYLTGLHLAQYRHATRRPEIYWEEAVRRDPGDSLSNNALGLWRLQRGEFALAEQHFRKAIERLTRLNPNPYDGAPYYNLGLALRFQGKDEQAYAAFYKAAWNAAWVASAYHALAEMDAKRADWTKAVDHLNRSLHANSENLNARNLKVMVLRKLRRDAEAVALLENTCRLDPLDIWSRFLRDGKVPADAQAALDLGLDLLRAGFYEEALDVLSQHDASPMPLYLRAHFLSRLGRADEAEKAYQKAAQADRDYCFPSRLEEQVVLEAAMAAHPGDARAPYYLGNFLYDKGRREEAIASWERAVYLEETNATAWRNLGIAYFNVLHDPQKSYAAFERAFAHASKDARILYERDQLWKRMGKSPEERLSELRQYPQLVQLRDDLSLEMATLLNQTGQADAALKLLTTRKFQPWEGGEGQVLAQYLRACLLMCKRALLQHTNLPKARFFFESALRPPQTLSEAKHLLANWSDVYYWAGVVCAEEGRHEEAREMWKHAARKQGDFQQMSVRTVSDMTFWTAMAQERLGQMEEARELFKEIHEYAEQLERRIPKIDYFATSLPTMLLFEEDLALRNKIEAKFLRAQAAFGLKRSAEAENLLKEVLDLDRNHMGAADLLEQLHSPVKRQ